MLMDNAWHGIDQAYRPSTVAAHTTHFKTFLAFLIFMKLPIQISVHNVLTFLEYLYCRQISPAVLKKSVSINSQFAPSPKGIFDIKTMYHISISCDLLGDPCLFRAIFLVAFFGFLRMSNIAPHSSKKFDPSKHILRQDLFFQPPGVHVTLKWSKTLQDHRAYHVVLLPQLANTYLCPARALHQLLATRPLPPSAPLFANITSPHNQIIDTTVRDALKFILRIRNIPLKPRGFHTFIRSGATFAFDNNVPLQSIMAHGSWK